MTKCPAGLHPFPVEDATGAYCEEHGLTMIWNPPPGSTPDATPEEDRGGEGDRV